MRDVGLAKELAQDALLAALEQWPESGVPDNPGAWLMATAKHRAIDGFRRDQVLERKREELGREIEVQSQEAQQELAAEVDDDIGDDLLSLIFTACHPLLSTEARVAPTLRLVGALTTVALVPARRLDRNLGFGQGPLGPHDALGHGRLGPGTPAGASSYSSALGRGPAGDAGSAGEEIFPSLCRELPVLYRERLEVGLLLVLGLGLVYNGLGSDGPRWPTAHSS